MIPNEGHTGSERGEGTCVQAIAAFFVFGFDDLGDFSARLFATFCRTLQETHYPAPALDSYLAPTTQAAITNINPNTTMNSMRIQASSTPPRSVCC